MSTQPSRLFSLALLALLACSHPSSDEPQGAATPSEPAIARAPAATAAPGANPDPGPGARNLDPEDVVPTAAFSDGANAFAKVRATVLANYHREGITEDDLYRAATAGMLEKLEPKMKKWNKLLSPREMTELKNDLKGEVVGVGVQIQFDEKSGYADVLATLPGSPSEKAGLLAGDKIVTVNGKLYKGMRLKDVVADIRGKAGESVTLSVLRGDKLVSHTIVRARVAYDQPTAELLPGALGYLRIPSFTEKTPGAVKAGLEDLEKKGAKALVFDLRHCPGGSFDQAIATAELLLPAGAGIVTLKRRGKGEERHVAKTSGVLTGVPSAVLVDGRTASGAEYLAAALQEGRHARVVGEKTQGKWSVQSLDELPNGYAFKYTVSLFHSPSGKNFEGLGMPPDVSVTMSEAEHARAVAATSPEARVAADTQLRTAGEILGGR